MKALGIRIHWLVLAILTSSSLVQAAPLDLYRVSGGAKWLFHFDADAARTASISQRFNEKLLENRPELQGFVSKIHEMTGMDFRTDLHDVTAYGNKLGSRNMVALIYADFDDVDLILRLSKAQDYKVTKYGTYDIHTWSTKNGQGLRPAALAIHKTDALIFASSVEEVQGAIDVYEGKTPSAMAGTGSPLKVNARRGTIVSLRATGFADLKIPPMFQALSEAKSVAVSVGESDKKVFIEAKGLMTSAEVADNTSTMLDGVRQLGKLRFADDEKTVALMNDVQIGADEKTVTAVLESTVDDLWQVMQARFGRIPGQARPGRPGDKPGNAPSDKPADKPADKPVDK